MYFSGKRPLMVRATLPPAASIGEGVTVKLSAESSPNLLQEVSTSALPIAKEKKSLLCME